MESVIARCEMLNICFAAFVPGTGLPYLLNIVLLIYDKNQYQIVSFARWSSQQVPLCFHLTAAIMSFFHDLHIHFLLSSKCSYYVSLHICQLVALCFPVSLLISLAQYFFCPIVLSCGNRGLHLELAGYITRFASHSYLLMKTSQIFSQRIRFTVRCIYISSFMFF